MKNKKLCYLVTVLLLIIGTRIPYLLDPTYGAPESKEAAMLKLALASIFSYLSLLGVIKVIWVYMHEKEDK